jgi:uncharacterized protein (DUF1015 family)
MQHDKITPEMRQRYLGLSPCNLVRIILGERSDSDRDGDNVYTRAAAYFRDWIAGGVLARDPTPSFYAYFQHFSDPDTGERLVRTGFIGLGPVAEYSAGVVHRHEQTLSGPRKDRLELLRHTRAHFGQIFMLYPDRDRSVDSLLEKSAAHTPLAEVTEEYGCLHRLWRVSDPGTVAEIARRMADKKLIIADGHHRYETALAYSKECSLDSAQRVMMTFVNMHSPGLRILATHRLVSGLGNFDPDQFLNTLASAGRIERVDSGGEFKSRFSVIRPGTIRLGVAMAARASTFWRRRKVRACSTYPLSTIASWRECWHRRAGRGRGANLRYVRGIDAAPMSRASATPKLPCSFSQRRSSRWPKSLLAVG